MLRTATTTTASISITAAGIARNSVLKRSINSAAAAAVSHPHPLPLPVVPASLRSHWSWLPLFVPTRRLRPRRAGSAVMASTAEEVRAYVWRRSARLAQEQERRGSRKGGDDAAAAPLASASAAAAVQPESAAPVAARPANNPMYGYGSKLSGAAKKSEQRRLRSYISITNAEEQAVERIFAEQPTTQIYIVRAHARTVTWG